MMFKLKHSLIAITITFSMPLLSEAKTLSCPFTDSFSLNGPVGTYILNASSEGNLKITKPSSTYFSLSCGDDQKSNSGDVFVDIGISDNNKCSLTIHDGPYEMNPTVSTVYCNGKLKYAGMDHVYGSYTYTLKFINS